MGAIRLVNPNPNPNPSPSPSPSPNPNPNQAGYTAIILAAAGGHHDCVNLLIRFRADVNAQNPVSRDPALPRRPLGPVAKGDVRLVV